MLKAKKIIRDLKNLKGNKVFGCYGTKNRKESRNLDMSELDVIRGLAKYEIDFKEKYGVDYDSCLYDDMGNISIEEFNCDNSYNWSSALVFEFGSTKVLETGETYTHIRFHRYGDVRGNYTDTMVLDLDSERLLYKLMEFSAVWTTINYKGIDYNISTDCTMEGSIYRVYCDNFDSDSAYLDIDNVRNMKDIKKGLVKYLKEENLA